MVALYSDFDKKGMQNKNGLRYNNEKHFGRTAVQRDKLAKIILLTLLFPLAIYMLGSCILAYIPSTESYKKTPKQFEELFNEKMAQYGMSMDIDSVDFINDENNLRKVVPIVCEDGSVISCTYYPSSDRETSVIEYVTFQQELTGDEEETTYLEQIFTFMLDTFETTLAKHKDETLGPSGSATYNKALDLCRDFIDGDEKEMKFFIFPEANHGRSVKFKREAGEKTILSVSLKLS